jgi:hypothetical protein
MFADGVVAMVIIVVQVLKLEVYVLLGCRDSWVIVRVVHDRAIPVFVTNKAGEETAIDRLCRFAPEVGSARLAFLSTHLVCVAGCNDRAVCFRIKGKQDTRVK